PRRIEALLPNLTFPLFQGRAFLGFSLGGVTFGRQGQEPARSVQAARALRLIYFLQEDRPSFRKASEFWLQAFLDSIPDLLDSLNLTSVRVAHFTSISRQKEFEKLAKDVMPLVSVAYLLTIFFSILSCARRDNVRTKVWIAVFGVISSGLSVISSFGLLLFCGVPFVITAANSPFLILGIGIDDMFILVSCWQRTQVKESIQNRMADTYAEAAMSVTITSLTNVLAFYIGIATSFPSVQSFCIYTGTAFIFCFIYNLTFLGAVLALNGKREESNRHWLTFRKMNVERQDSQGCLYKMCCTGGSFDESTGTEYEHPVNEIFKKYYGPFFMNRWAKVFVVFLYFLYLASSILGCIQVEEGINLRNVATDNSYIIPYYDFEDEYFYKYGPRVMVVVTESVAYWDQSVRDEIENCMAALESSNFIDTNLSESWLRIYQTVAKRMSLDINNHSVFVRNLATLFALNPEYKWDVNMSQIDITASRFFIQTINVVTAVDEKNLLNELRAFAEDCKVPMIVNHPAFVHFDQFLVIIQNTIQNVLIATGAMLLVSLLLIPNPLCSLWVTFAIVSVITGVSGYMAFWGINLDSISMINLVICIGFSVDYSAHISYAFVSSEKPTVNEKAVDALYRLGYPIVQAACSTLVGVFVLSLASTYVFRTCPKPSASLWVCRRGISLSLWTLSVGQVWNGARPRGAQNARAATGRSFARRPERSNSPSRTGRKEKEAAAMPDRGWHTDCVERPLARLLRALGASVGAHPWPFLVFPLALAGALGVGFRHVRAREANDLEEQYTPSGGPAKSERRWVQEHFPSDDASRFSAQRLSTEGTFASLVVLSADGEGSVLTPTSMAEVMALDAAVRRFRGEGNLFVTHFTSLSRQKEFNKISKKVVPLISITYFLTIFFSIMSCSRMDCVRTKVWVAAFGVLSSGLAVVSSFGLLMFCGVPFVITAANSPFLILGVGVDDMFIMVSCWQHSQVKSRIRDRMADTYEEAAVSVTITTLTDVLAFYIGIGRGSFDESTGAETEHPMTEFFRKYYGPFLMQNWVKILVVVMYLLYVGSSIYGCTLVKEGINVRNLAVDHSYVVQYYDWEDEYFSEYGPRIMVVVNESVAYWDPSVRADIEKCMDALERSSFIDKDLSESWLRIYETVAKLTPLNINDKNIFIGNLRALNRINPEYEQDINHHNAEILASRFFIQAVNITTAVDEKNLLNELRNLAEECKIPLIVYHPAFIYFDQYVVIVRNTIQNVLIATGFSVDYSAHISYAFVSSGKSKVNEKAVDALYALGYPIVQASASTLVGVFVLSILSSESYQEKSSREVNANMELPSVSTEQ
ncbi:hypothetical protein JD844_003354, partial [Phrynosoma platyrhinos]